MAAIRPSQLAHPAVQRLVRVARALGELTERVVFIGGAIAPLLHSDPPFDEARATADVDGIIASTSYSAMEQLYEMLRARGFRQVLEVAHLNRWRTSEGDLFDLMSANDHLGGSAKMSDRLALETSVDLTLEDAFVLRYASAPAFLGQKWSAFDDRGSADPFASHDLQDIIALIASRPSLIEELRGAPNELRALIVTATRQLLSRADVDDLIAANLSNAQSPAVVANRVRGRLTAIAQLD